MTDHTFVVWLCTCAGALVLAFASALYLSSATDTPTGRHRAGAPRSSRVELDGLRTPAYHRRAPERFPASAAVPSPAPVRLPRPEHTPPLGPTRQQIEARAVEREQRAHPAVEPVVEPAVEPVVEPTVEPVVEPTVEPVVEPVVEYRPITGRVVPLWEKTEERRRQLRLRVLTAVAEGLPDPGYTYEGAHCLGAVA